jgi:hypothetical protein
MSKELSVKLQYMNNAYSTLQTFWGLRGRLALAVIVLSLILLAIATGVSSLQEKLLFSFFGVQLRFLRPNFLAAGAIVLAALFVSWWAVLLRVQYLRKELERLYQSLGYSADEAMYDAMKSPFHSATWYGALIAPYASAGRRRQGWFVNAYDRVVSEGVALLLVGILPIVTEVVILLSVLKWTMADTTVANRLQSWMPTWIAENWITIVPVILTIVPVICVLITILITICALVSYRLKKPT